MIDHFQLEDVSHVNGHLMMPTQIEKDKINMYSLNLIGI